MQPIMQPTIRVDSAVTTLVNIFTVTPDTQPKTHALLKESIETLFRTLPGWISSNLVKSRDGTRIIVYSQWRSADDIEAYRRDPGFQAHIRRFDSTQVPDSFICDVSYSLHA